MEQNPQQALERITESDARATPTVPKAILDLIVALQHMPPPPPAAPAVVVDRKDWADQLVDALLRRIVRRVPLGGKKEKAGQKGRPGEHCPFSGLNRNQIYEAMKPRKDGRPWIRTKTLKEKGEKHGARFYYVSSALDYVAQLPDEETPTETPSVKSRKGRRPPKN